jgi:hypothetical protein
MGSNRHDVGFHCHNGACRSRSCAKNCSHWYVYTRVEMCLTCLAHALTLTLSLSHSLTLSLWLSLSWSLEALQFVCHILGNSSRPIAEVRSKAYLKEHAVGSASDERSATTPRVRRFRKHHRNEIDWLDDKSVLLQKILHVEATGDSTSDSAVVDSSFSKALLCEPPLRPRLLVAPRSSEERIASYSAVLELLRCCIQNSNVCHWFSVVCVCVALRC